MAGNYGLVRDSEVSRDEIIKIRLIDGAVQEVKKKNIVGLCHSTIHPGALTKRFLEDHDCLGKACVYFEKNEGASYWLALLEKQQRKEKVKNKKLARKNQQQKQENALLVIKYLFQDYVDDIGYDMEIIRVEELRRNTYKVFYVSEYPFADGNRFPEFLALARENHPSWRICLRHIQDVDGHFVTCDEFFSRV